MAAKPNNNAGPLLVPEIGPDGLARESPVIAYTERVIEEEQVQLRKYIEENYSKIRDVERELANLNMEMKLTSGPKKAALEHMRKKIEMATERIRVAKINEEQAKKAWEAAAKAVQGEEAIKQKLSEDLNNLVQESSNTQLSRLEELKRRLEALNPGRSSKYAPSVTFQLPNSRDVNQRSAETSIAQVAVPTVSSTLPENISIKSNHGNAPVIGQNQPPSTDIMGRGEKKSIIQGKIRGIGAVPKDRGPGWTGSGFDVDGRD